MGNCCVAPSLARKGALKGETLRGSDSFTTVSISQQFTAEDGDVSLESLFGVVSIARSFVVTNKETGIVLVSVNSGGSGQMQISTPDGKPVGALTVRKGLATLTCGRAVYKAWWGDGLQVTLDDRAIVGPGFAKGTDLVLVFVLNHVLTHNFH